MKKFQVYNQLPELYDQIYGGDDNKVLDFVRTIFEREKIQKSDSILDMGAGTGGLLIPLSEEGYDIVGYEPHDGMIAQAIMKSKALEVKIKITKGSFETLDEKETYKFVLAMNGPLHFVDQSDVLSVFERISNSVVAGGYFLVDLINFYSLIKYYQYPEPQQLKISGKPAHTNVKHSVDLVNEKWTHQSILFIENEGGWDKIEDIQVMSMYNLHQLKLLGFHFGLKLVKSYTSYTELDSVSGTRLLALFKKSVN